MKEVLWFLFGISALMFLWRAFDDKVTMGPTAGLPDGKYVINNCKEVNYPNGASVAWLNPHFNCLVTVEPKR